MAATVESVTTRWRLDPPVDMPASFQRQGKPQRMVRITVVERTAYHDREEYWSVQGIPLTTKGNPNGSQDWRSISDDDLARLAALVVDAPPFDPDDLNGPGVDG